MRPMRKRVAVNKKYHLLPWMERELRNRYGTARGTATTDLAARFDVPIWTIREWARNLGVAKRYRPDRRWSEEEIAFLKEYYGKRNIERQLYTYVTH